MKPFKKIKIVACLMIHDENPEYLTKCLFGLLEYTDKLYINLNDPTEKVKHILNNYGEYIQKIIYTSNEEKRWNQGLQRDNTLRMLDNVQPDIVIWPDSDEVYASNFKEELINFWGDKIKQTWWARLLYLWNDEKHFRNDNRWKSVHACRAFRWRPKLTFNPYPGYTCPKELINLSKESRFNSEQPIIHYGYMQEEDRNRKEKRANSAWCDPAYREKIDENMLILPVPKDLW